LTEAQKKLLERWSRLSEEQQELLLEPFVSSRHLFVSDPFPAICSFLNAHPGLRDILQLLHQR
jgi:hypothetical protein